MDSLEVFDPIIYLKNGDDLSEYGIAAKVVELPGHTKGSIGVEIEDNLFVGDALMNMFYPTVSMLYVDEQEILLLLQKDESLIFKPFSPENIEALSLLPLTDCNEVTLQGVQWNLEYAPLLSAHPYAISNMVEQEKVVFTCNQGRVGFYLKYKL